jgi:hypothetical protein
MLVFEFKNISFERNYYALNKINTNKFFILKTLCKKNSKQYFEIFYSSNQLQSSFDSLVSISKSLTSYESGFIDILCFAKSNCSRFLRRKNPYYN